MYYQDIIKLAKKYGYTFEYGLGKSSFRSPLFWTSLVFLGGMIFFLISTFTPLLPAASKTFIFTGMLTTELIFLASFITHIEREKRTKRIKLGAFDPIADKGKSELTIRGQWLEKHLPYPRESYSKIVESFEDIDSRIKSDHRRNKSPFDIYISGIFKWRGVITWLATILFAPVAVTTALALLEDKPWTRPIKPVFTIENLNNLGIILVGLFIIGGILAFAGSLIKILFNYLIDVVFEHGCSDNSVNILIRDLLYLSSLEIPSTPDTGEQNKPHSELQDTEVCPATN